MLLLLTLFFVVVVAGIASVLHAASKFKRALDRKAASRGNERQRRPSMITLESDVCMVARCASGETSVDDLLDEFLETFDLTASRGWVVDLPRPALRCNVVRALPKS
jgi:hypothetical protein